MKRFFTIAGALDLSGQTIIDGEVVVVLEGRTNFPELHADLAAGKQDHWRCSQEAIDEVRARDRF